MDPTHFSTARHYYQSTLELLLGFNAPRLFPAIEKETLYKFVESFGHLAFVCSYLSCARATNGFDSSIQRDAHETIHEPKFRCAYQSCVYFARGFATRAALKKHNNTYHPSADENPPLSEIIGRARNQPKAHNAMSQFGGEGYNWASFSGPEDFEEYMNGQPPDAKIIEQRNMANQTGVFKSSGSPKPVICPWCDGRGGKEGAVKKCAGCDGHGMKAMMRQMGPMIQRFHTVCSDCNGEGEIIREKDRCKQCNGKKTIVERKVLHNVDRGEHTNPSSAIVTFEKVGARDQELISQRQPRGGSLQRPSTPQVPGTPRPLVTERKSTAIIQARLNKGHPARTVTSLRLVSEYPQYRAIARDDDASWRAIAFSYYEVILKLRKQNGIIVELNRLESINRAIIASGCFTAWNFNILSMEIETLLRQLNVLHYQTSSPLDYLLRHVNAASHSAPTIRYFRLLASWCLKQNFQHYRTRKCYCPETELEGCMWLETPGSPMGPLGFTILLDILLIPVGSGLEIVYGDSCISMPIAARDTTGDEHTNAGQTIYLLYWGGHYDILYKDEDNCAHD
jgi:hypothetical protein